MFELLGPPFDHTGAGQPAVFVQLHVVHAPMIIAKVMGLLFQGLLVLGLVGSSLFEGIGELTSVTLIEQGFIDVRETWEGWIRFWTKKTNSGRQMLFGVIPVDHLM